jgi:hypothetical protein
MVLLRSRRLCAIMPILLSASDITSSRLISTSSGVVYGCDRGCNYATPTLTYEPLRGLLVNGSCGTKKGCLLVEAALFYVSECHSEPKAKNLMQLQQILRCTQNDTTYPSSGTGIPLPRDDLSQGKRSVRCASVFQHMLFVVNAHRGREYPKSLC